MGCTEVKVEESLFVGWYRFCLIILARSLISLSLSPSHSSRTHSLSHLSEWIEQIKILDNALLPNNNKKNEVEDEAAPNTGSLSLSVATSSSSSTISSFDRTLTSSNSQSSSDLSLLTSASSFPSGLGDQSDKEDSVGHGDTQSNLDGQNGNSGEQDGSHDPKSQKEEGKGDLGHGGGNRNEIGSSPNQEEFPSQDRSPAQIAGSDNGGNGKHVGNNKVDVPDNSSE